jgi:hypothetical protein
MTDPERLLAGGTAFERSLLVPAAVEKPSAAMLARMEHALGLPSAAGGSVAAGSAATASAVSAKLVLAVLGTGAAGGLAIWGLVAASNPSPTTQPQVDTRSVAASVAASKAEVADEASAVEGARAAAAERSKSALGESEAESGRGTELEDLPLVADEPARARAAAAREPAPHRSHGAAPSEAPALKSDQLKLEVQQLDRVRAALAAGERERAVQLLDGYDRKFPNGTLLPEAAKLRRSAKE